MLVPDFKRKLGALFLAYLLSWLPLFPLTGELIAKAADGERRDPFAYCGISPSGDDIVDPYDDSFSEEGGTVSDDLDEDDGDSTPLLEEDRSSTITPAPIPEETADGEPGDAAASVPFVEKSVIEQLVSQGVFGETSYDQFVAENPDFKNLLLRNDGWYDEIDQVWYFCSEDGLTNFFHPAPLWPGAYDYLKTASFPFDKIVFKHERDRFALFGESCRLFTESGVCSEEKGTDGTPLYYDEYWENGAWDAPKADVRILQMLVYLVTPIERGGAGRERITVGKIIQPTLNNSEFDALNDEGQELDETLYGDDAIEAALQAEPDEQESAHAYDLENPSRPTFVASAVDITEIDNLRVTTKIVQRRRLGGSTTSYRYQQFPIKVAWQTDRGIEEVPPPNPRSFYEGALTAFSFSFLQLLDQFDLEAEFDVSSYDINSFSDLANLIGQSLFAQLLSSPTSGLKGWDFGSLIENIARSYLAQELGLPAGSFSEGDTVEELIENIGRTKVESVFGFPRGSLTGDTTEAIFTNIAIRYLEDVVFRVARGTLSEGGLPADEQALLTRLGEGKIEKALTLPPQSTRPTDWREFLNGSAKTSLVFKRENANEIDDRLMLGFQAEVTTSNQSGQPSNMHGFLQSDFQEATRRLIESASDTTLAKYKQLVGSRVIEAGIGRFSPKVVGPAGIQPFVPTGNGSTSYQNTNGQADFTVDLPARFGIGIYDLSSPSQRQEYTSAVNGGATAVTTNNPNLGVAYSGTGQQLVTVGAFTAEEFAAFALRIANARVGKTFDTGSGGFFGFNQGYIEPGRAQSLYDVLNASWDPVLREALQRLEVERQRRNLNRQAPVASGSFVDNDGLQNLTNAVSSTLSDMRRFREGLVTIIESVGQSGRSTALDIPGASDDIINSILVANWSQLELIGRSYAAALITEDRARRHNLGKEIQQDLDPFFDLAEQIGLDTSFLEDEGILQNDFERIFSKGLSRDTFYRIGQTELLRVLWNKGIAEKLDTPGVNGTLDDLRRIVQDITFYTTRLDRVQANLDRLIPILERLNPVLKEGAEEAKELLRNRPQNIEDMQRLSEEAQAALSRLRTLREEGENIEDDLKEAIKLSNAINQDLQEIIAGQELSFTQSVEPLSSGSLPSLSRGGGDCWRANVLRAVLAGSGEVTPLLAQIGGCKLDEAFGLPSGTMYSWYELEKESGFSIEGLRKAVGIAIARLTGRQYSDEELAEIGDRELQRILFSILSQSIPGFRDLAGLAGLKTDDLFELLMGRGEFVFERLGARLMEKYLNWPRGTADNLINPVCYEEDGRTRRLCEKSEVDTARLNALARIGLREFGLAIKLPNTFDMFAPGNFLQNYGAARIAEQFGLKAGSFKGSFIDVINANAGNEQALLSGFGWYDTKPMANLRSLLSQIGISSPEATAVLEQGIGELSNLVFAEMKTAGSQLWQNASLTDLAQREKDVYLATLRDTASALETGTYTGGPDAEAALQRTYGFLNQVTYTSEWDSQRLSELNRNRESFQRRLDTLATTFEIARERFVNFLQGTEQADALNQTIGANELPGKLAEDQIERLLEGTPFEGIADTFRVLTRTEECRDGITIAEFILGTGGACGRAALGDVSLADLLNGTDPLNQQKRLYLYDFLGGRAFSYKIESMTGLPRGTIRRIVREPWRAQEIGIDAGIRMLSDQVLSLRSSVSEGDQRDLFDAIHGSLMAGLCDFDSREQLCTLNFNKDRALENFRLQLDKIVERDFRTRDNLDTITLTDLASLMIGGTQGFAYIGSAKIAAALNEQILSKNHPRARDFMIQFRDIYLAFGNTARYTDAELTRAENSAIDTLKLQFDLEKAGLLNSDIPAMGAYGYATWEEFSNSYTGSLVIEQHKEEARQEYVRRQRAAARDRLLYRMYDAAAFNIDPNIPVGFSWALIKGSGADKTRALSLYALNTLKIGESVFGGALTSEQIFAIVDCTNRGFTGDGCLLAQNSALSSGFNALDGWFRQQFRGFGIALPSGVVPSLFAWGVNGFAGNLFDSSTKISFAGREFTPPGTLLRESLTRQVYNWLDHQLGFQRGGTFQIAEATRNFLLAQRQLNDLRAIAAGGQVSITPDAMRTAQNNLRLSQANLAATIINVAFASEIAAAEQSLGLVPGTGALAITLLAQLVVGAPVDPITLALFIGLNLFGVYRVDIYVKATADGYYPFTGRYRQPRIGPSGIPSGRYEIFAADRQSGEFDAKDPDSYRAGIKRAAQNKVRETLAYILAMPGGRWAQSQGIAGENIWVSQAFTARVEDLEALDYLISRNAPWDKPADWGYGKLEDRADLTFHEDGSVTAEAKDGVRAGFFANQEAFWSHLHVRW